MAGIRTPDLPSVSTLDTFLGNKDSGAGSETVQATAALVAAQMQTLIQFNSAVVAVVTKTLSAPPGSPTLGDRYIVNATGTGAWAGHDNAVATYTGSGWNFVTPLAGYRAFLIDEKADYFWDATASKWTVIDAAAFLFATVAEMNAVTGAPANLEAHVVSDVIGKTASRARASNVATIVMQAEHSLTTGQKINVRGLSIAGYDANQVTVTVTNTTTYTYPSTGGNESTTADTAGQADRNGAYASNGSGGWVWKGDIDVTALNVKINILSASVDALSSSVTALSASVTSLVATAGATAADKQLLDSMPPGAIGMWPFDRIQSEPVAHIPNILNRTPPPAGILTPASRMFSSALFYKYLATATDDALTDPYGGTEASYLNISAGGFIERNPAITLPAGTYTLALSCIRNDATDQQFCLTKDGAVTKSSPFTVSNTWLNTIGTRPAYTFTIASSTSLALGICAIDGSTPAKIGALSFDLFRGAADLGPSRPCDHLILSTLNSVTAYAAGELALAGKYGIIQRPTAITPATWTIQALIKLPGAIINGSNPILTKAQSYAAFTVDQINAGLPRWVDGTVAIDRAYAANPYSGIYQYDNFVDMVGRGYHLLTVKYDGTTREIWVDDFMLFHDEWAFTTPSLRDFGFNCTALNSGMSTGNWSYSGALAFWDRALSQAEIEKSFWVQKYHALVNGQMLDQTVDRVMVVNGDSISGGNGATTWPFLYASHDNPAVWGSVWSFFGSQFNHAVTRSVQINKGIPTNRAGRKFIYVIPIGTNVDPAYPDAATFVAALKAHCVAQRALGWIPVICTLLPGDGLTAFNVIRNAVNTDMRANTAAYGNAYLIDFAADLQMGPDNSRTLYPTLWADAVHPSNAGYVIMEGIARPVLNGI
ncbi:hypothetical+protein [Methylocapsa aurea]